MTERTCPITTSEIPLLHTPREVVASVFYGLGISYRGELGGTRRLQAPITDADHVEMTFSKEQLPYIKTITLLLNSMAKGSQTTLSYADHVVANYTSYENTDQGNKYATALTDSSLILLQTFSSTHPNLIPGLHGMFEVAGAEGMRTALMRSRMHLYHVNKNIQSGKALLTGLNNNISREEFAAIHSNTSPSFEVRCASEILAKTLIAESKKAAVTIATTQPQGRDFALPITLTSSETYDAFFRQVVRELATKNTNETSS